MKQWLHQKYATTASSCTTWRFLMGLSLSGGLYSSTYCPSLVSSVHIVKHLHTPCVKHFKRDVFCFHRALKTLNYMLVCEPPVMVHKGTHLCSFISASKGDSLVWRYISQPHADTHCHAITVISSLQVSVVLSLQTHWWQQVKLRSTLI